MGRTTVVIDDNLLKTAIRVAGVKNKRMAIEEGLKELVRKKNIESLRKEMGTFDLDLSLVKLNRIRKE